MTKQNNLFLTTLDALHKSGVFEDIILIAGSLGVNPDNCLNELPSSSFKYLKIPVCICERTRIY